jgi:hypothetical protein
MVMKFGIISITWTPIFFGPKSSDLFRFLPTKWTLSHKLLVY